MGIDVSVIIPIYNCESYLYECLNSLCCQAMNNAEFICVNDGSTDRSLSICEEFSSKDSRFKVISQENSGPAKARNIGICNSKGKYLCFLDSDDYLETNALTLLFGKAESGNYDIVVHGTNVISDDDKVPEWIQRNIAIKDEIVTDFKPEMVFQKCGCRPFMWAHFVKRSIIADNNIIINEKLKIGEDQAFEIMYFSYAKRVLFIKDKLYFYRVTNNNSIMSYYNNKKIEKMKQHVVMVQTVSDFYLSKDYITEMRGCLIHWVLDTFYWDLIGLLYRDQIIFLEPILEILDKLGVSYCISVMSDVDISKYNQMKIIFDYRDDPLTMINKLKDMNIKNKSEINSLHKNIFYKIGKHLFK